MLETFTKKFRQLCTSLKFETMLYIVVILWLSLHLMKTFNRKISKFGVPDSESNLPKSFCLQLIWMPIKIVEVFYKITAIK